MKILTIILIILIAALGSAAAYYLISPAFVVIESNEASPVNTMITEVVQMPTMPTAQEMSDATILSTAYFKPHDHDVEGKALLIDDNGKKIVRFEDFDTVNGPELHVYLSTDLDAKDYIDLGEIKATRGNVNYDVPMGIDVNKYNKVLVWCEPFSVLFSYAELE